MAEHDDIQTAPQVESEGVIPAQAGPGTAADSAVMSPAPKGANTAPGPRQRRPWPRWAYPAVAGVAGLLVGGAIGALAVAASTDPTQSKEYHSLQATMQSKLSEAQTNLDAAHSAMSAAQEAGRSAQAAASASVAALDQREAQVAARESAVSAAEHQVAQNSISEGTWTVGSDIQPGRYRTSAPVAYGCYWMITKSGTNGSDIIQNDLPTGGYPTVNLSAGQDFTTKGCGTWLKQ